MRLYFFGDVHIGFVRRSFTASNATGRYSVATLKTIDHLLKKDKNAFNIQIGDLFHKFKSSDIDLATGVDISKKMNLVIAGNHDISNTLESDSTLSMCSEISGTNTVFPNKEGDATYYHEEVHNSNLFAIPYCYTQDQFELSLKKVKEEATHLDNCILLLHTNFSIGFDTTETTNNLSRETARDLLTEFEYIISGHEHNYSERFKGRLIMSGSVIPLSTSELEDKYVHVYNTETCLMDKIKVWDAKEHYRNYDINDLPESLPDQVQFVVVSGEAKVKSQSADFQRMSSKWWRDSKHLLVCKPEFSIPSTQTSKKVELGTDLIAYIRGKVASTELFDTIIEEIDNAQ